MKIFGLAGKKQCGKNSFAKFATEIIADPINTKCFAFADPLKDFCIKYLGLPEKSCYGNNFEKNQWVGKWSDFFDNHELISQYNRDPLDNISGRQVLQVVGTNVFRQNFKQSFWVDIFVRKLQHVDEKTKALFITDVRFPNEFEILKKMGAKMVLLYRNTGTVDSIAHESETSLSAISETDFDYVIDSENNTSLKKLRKQVVKILYNEGLL